MGLYLYPCPVPGVEQALETLALPRYWVEIRFCSFDHLNPEKTKSLLRIIVLYLLWDIQFCIVCGFFF